MGYWKEKGIEFEERGYGTIDTVVCRDCFGDYALKDFIKRTGIKQKCDYCGKTRLCANLEDIIGQIVSSAFDEFEDAKAFLLNVWIHNRHIRQTNRNLLYCCQSAVSAKAWYNQNARKEG